MYENSESQERPISLLVKREYQLQNDNLLTLPGLNGTISSVYLNTKLRQHVRLYVCFHRIKKQEQSGGPNNDEAQNIKGRHKPLVFMKRDPDFPPRASHWQHLESERMKLNKERIKTLMLQGTGQVPIGGSCRQSNTFKRILYVPIISYWKYQKRIFKELPQPLPPGPDSEGPRKIT